MNQLYVNRQRKLKVKSRFFTGFILSFLSFVLVANTAYTQSIFTNPITDPSPFSSNPFTTGQTVNANITVSGIGRGSGIAGNAGSNRYNANNWSTGALDPDDYFEFTLAPNAGYRINFTSFVYTGQVSSGIPGFKFRSSLDGFTADIGSPTATGTTINLSAAAYQAIASAITFRFYVHNIAGAGTTYSINDFTFNGTCVPGPSLVAGTLTGFGNVCTGTVPGVNIFTLSGSALSGANITVAALAGFTYSRDNVTFTPTLNFAQAAGTMAATNIYVRFSPVLVQSYNGNIVVGGGGAPSINVAATGSGVNTSPTIENGTVSAVTTNTANVNATVSSNGCSALSAYGVEYSTTPGFANGSGTAVAGGAISAGNFTSNLVGLAPPGQTFYFHTYATNSGGTSYGTEGSFTLLNTTPTLTVPPSGAGSLAAFGNVCTNTSVTDQFTLSGSVLNGANVVVGPLSGYRFSTASGGPFTNTLTLVNGGVGYSYSAGTLTASIYVQFLPTLVQSYNGNIPVSGGGAAAISVAASGNGVNDVPTLTTDNALFITTTGAILPGTILTTGCGVLLNYGIEYSTTPGFAPGTGTQVAASNLGAGDFSVTLSTLLPNTTYYYYAYASTAGGTGYGAINSFLTATAPTKLVITSIFPASPTALTPFTITITAVDDLVNMNPTNVTANTDITLTQVAGANILTFPATPAGTIPAGAHSITVTGTFYDVPETGVGITATASSGMVSLGTSAIFTFNVVAYAGPSNFIWSGNGNSAWLTGGNWQTGTAPGGSLVGLNQHVASFTSLAAVSTSATGGCGINMNSVGGDYSIGTIYFTQTYASTHTGDIVPIGNSSTSASGILSVYGTIANTVGGIGGNNYSSLLLANYMNSATTKTLEIRNAVGSGNKNLTLNLASAGSIVAGVDRTININTLLTGTQNLTFNGGGTFKLMPSGAASVNTFSGAVFVANGTLITGNTGAFNVATPNVVTLGSNPSNAGVLRLNGNSVSIGGLTSAGGAGNLNIVDNGNASATLTVNNATAYIFQGALKNGSVGTLSLVKNGAGSLTLQGLNTLTGTTTINNGTLVLGRAGGATYPSANSVTVNGTGTLQVSSDQTLKDITLATGGTLRVDAGVTLTITGIYNAAACNIINNGTIRLQGAALQTFPGTAATVSVMNNLTVNNLFGVNLNKSLNIAGTLQLSAGTFTVGAYTLTLNNPITGTLTNFSANNTSSIVIAGTAPGVDIPAVVTQLKALTVSNTVGSTLQGPLQVTTTLFISAGTLYDNQFVLNGAANTTMTGGNLYLEQNTATLPGLTGIYNLTGGTVTFAGVGIGSDAQTVRPINYFNLSSTANGDRILSPSGTIGVSNVFTPNLPLNTYTIDNSTINYNKAAAQPVAGFNYYNITISGGGGNIKTLSGNISIVATLTLATSTRFALDNFNATLRSDASNTANVAAINTANSITYGTGRFVVERYIPTGVSHGKTWQLLSVPVSGTTSVQASWQEGNAPLANALPGYGTTLSSEKPGAVGRGYDFYTPVAPSIKTYNSATDTWSGIDDGSTQTASLPIANKKGYMVFVRGDRSVQSSAAAANTTTLRTSGKLFSPGTDAPPSTTIAAGKMESVGNPYASAIDFVNLQATSAGIDSKYYVWDPLLAGSSGYGGYQLLSSTNAWMPVPGGTTNYPTGVAYTKIQSGQAFFAYSTPGGTVNFAESNKSTGNNLGYRVGNAGSRFLRAWIYNDNGTMLDGNVLVFGEGYSRNFDADDALKLASTTESFAISSNNRLMALEAKRPVVSNDTVFYHFGNLHVRTYQLHFTPEHLDAGISAAFLVDRYLGTSTPLSLTGSSIVSFSVNNDTASGSASRFYVVFRPTATVPVNFTGLSAVRNRDNDIEVKWTVANEVNIRHYELERSGDGARFTLIATKGQVSNNGGSHVYTFTDTKYLDTDNYYRVRSTELGGNSGYSPVVKVSGLKASPLVSIYPNPVVDKMMNISFTGLPAGTCQVSLRNAIGQVVYRSSFNISTNNELRSLRLGSGIGAGVYQLEVNAGKNSYRQQVLIQ